ncbi:MAG: adenosine deaminase, partial [Gammaproteobacteria bacterium]|nr:adenosine deaminase [Gammaproteobacteria bacterium]
MNWRRTLNRVALLLALVGGMPEAVAGDWFERFKAEATDGALHRFLYAMPKGGDLHLHLTGSALSEWLHEIALAEMAQGVAYYAKTRIDNCAVDAGQADAYLLLYRIVDQHRMGALSECERSEYQALSALDAKARAAWMNSVRLDAPHEGRD